MSSIGFLLHPGEEASIGDALVAARECGYDTWTALRDFESALPERAATTALVVTVGGDGTFLLGARAAAEHGLPVLGVNRGRLGFLTDVEVAQLPEAIATFARGEHREQRRSMLRARLERGGPDIGSNLALNDVVIKSPEIAAARLRLECDGELFGDYDADGLIIATATGSTAYALSAGGPPVDPRVHALVVVPLAVHAVMSRAMILPDAVTLRVSVLHGHVIAATDGQHTVILTEGDAMSIEPGPELVQVRLPGADSFAHRLRGKLRMGMPLKVDHYQQEGHDAAS